MDYKESIDSIVAELTEYAVKGKLSIMAPPLMEHFCWQMLNNKSTGEFRQYVTNHILHLPQNYKKHGADSEWRNKPIEQKSKNILNESADFYDHSVNDYNQERYAKDLSNGLLFIHGGWYGGRILGCVKYPIDAINPEHVKRCIDRTVERQRRNLSIRANDEGYVQQSKITAVYINPHWDTIPELSEAAQSFVAWVKQFDFEDMEANKITCATRLTWDILSHDAEIW